MEAAITGILIGAGIGFLVTGGIIVGLIVKAVRDKGG